MSGTDATAAGAWQVDLVEDVDLPGWVWLPESFEPGQRDAWVAETVPVLLDLVGAEQPDGTPNTVADVRGLLEAGLDARAQSDSYAMYQVWPIRAAAAVMCHVNRVHTEDLPDLAAMDGRLLAAEARHIGPGVQLSSRMTVDTVDGPMSLAAVYFVFADQDDAVVVHLDPSLPELVAQSLLAVGMFVNALEVTREDGSTLTSVAPSGLVLGDQWPTDTEGA